MSIKQCNINLINEALKRSLKSDPILSLELSTLKEEMQTSQRLYPRNFKDRSQVFLTFLQLTDSFLLSRAHSRSCCCFLSAARPNSSNEGRTGYAILARGNRTLQETNH
jgi:hypothetical protein